MSARNPAYLHLLAPGVIACTQCFAFLDTGILQLLNIGFDDLIN